MKLIGAWLPRTATPSQELALEAPARIVDSSFAPLAAWRAGQVTSTSFA